MDGPWVYLFPCDQFPLWLAVIVGAMLLGNVGYHLCMFTDCADAHAELQQVRRRARLPPLRANTPIYPF